MKQQNKTRNAGVALIALIASIGLTSTASAIPLIWLDGPQAGQAFGGGGIQIKAVNYDTGTLYNPLTVGTARGFGVSPAIGATDVSVAGGEATLNALPGRPVLNGVGTEDSWGILKITDIQGTASDGVLHSLYNSVASPFELTAMFWGERDFYLNQVSAGSNLPGGGQIIDGTSMRVDIYSGAVKDFNQTPGPAGRSTVSTYPTATNGTLELSLLSTNGFINANGTLGGVPTEFESNTSNVGYAALNVIGGASATQFDTNRIGFQGSFGGGFQPGMGTQTSTDIWFSFTSTQGVNGWDVTSNDPMLAATIPVGGSTIVSLLGALACLAAVRRRLAQRA